MYGDHLPNSHDLYVLKYIDMMRRNLMLITIGAEGAKQTAWKTFRPGFILESGMAGLPRKNVLAHKICACASSKAHKISPRKLMLLSLRAFSNKTGSGAHAKSKSPNFSYN